jgi:hypothetical protein
METRRAGCHEQLAAIGRAPAAHTLRSPGCHTESTRRCRHRRLPQFVDTPPIKALEQCSRRLQISTMPVPPQKISYTRSARLARTMNTARLSGSPPIACRTRAARPSRPSRPLEVHRLGRYQSLTPPKGMITPAPSRPCSTAHTVALDGVGRGAPSRRRRSGREFELVRAPADQANNCGGIVPLGVV